ncbi:MAG TPA: DinB family protein [Terriglobales bacterium]|nr:DinB family protein [Terriglobales bacterium]
MNLYGPKQLVESMRTVRKNTIQIAEDIPEKDYSYRPTPESRSAAETLVHIAGLATFDRFVHEEQRLSSLEGFDFGALISKSELEEKRPRSKREIVDLLRTEGERWRQWVESLPEAILAEQVRMPGGASKTRFELLLGTKEHEMQHRAQLTVIERLLGIVPHLTRNRRQAREAAAKAS